MGDQWYAARDGETYGPVSFERLLAAARDSELRRDDLVWSEGMETWRIASSIPALWDPILPSAPKSDQVLQNTVSAGTAEPAAEPSTQQPTSRGANFILRHWRGQLSLAVSYWVIGFLLTFVVLVFARAFGDALEILQPGLVPLGLLLSTFFLFLSAVTIWQLVGVWRSAGNHITSSGRRLWGTIARVAVIIGALRGGGDFVQTILPMLAESSKMAVGIDGTPPHRMRFLRNGTEVELAGGMPFGTADALRKLLDAAPAVRTVHLNSLGGRVSEGYEIHRLLRDRRLAAYTAADCVSACTIAFLGGTERLLSEKARLGFHSLSFGTLDQKQLPEINQDVRRTMLAHGVPAAFIDKALGTSANSMWYPTTQELVSARIVTRVVDPAQFGLSGIANWRDQQSVEDGLLSMPLYAALRQYDPAAYAKLSPRWTEGVRLGKSALEIRSEMEVIFAAEVLPRYLQSGPTAPLLRYWRSQLAETEFLQKKDPKLCVAYLFPAKRDPGFNPQRILPEALVKEDTAALVDLIRETPRRAVPAGQLDLGKEMLPIFQKLSVTTPKAAEIMSDPERFTGQPQLLCALTLALYREIMKLQPEKAASVLRGMMAK
jgi:hypothetical protein